MQALPAPVEVRALVVDDSAANRQLLRVQLEHRGCHVATATNGEEAVAALHGADYDLVFMDCQMPVMDGYLAARRIRRRERAAARRVTIVAMSADPCALARERCLQAGMDDCLPKPIREQDLDDMLQRWGPTARTA